MVLIDETNKKDCCGCTACASICPKNAITMKEDFEGFLYPVIDKDKCINCGLCDSVCQYKNKKENYKFIKAFSIQNKDERILENSTSGGFFTPLAEFILKENGYVFGAVFNEKKEVEHIMLTKNEIDQVYKFRGSKYVQSNLGATYKKVKKLLDNDKKVCFSGTPCQVLGLKQYLKREYENLITVDFVCRSVPSPLFLKKYIEYQKEKYRSDIKEFHFRSKTYGYHSGTLTIKFENGKKYTGSNRVDLYNKCFHSDICSRPSCYNCSAKGIDRLSDYTVFDSWQPSKLNKTLVDNDKGYSNLFIHTQKGYDLFFNIISKSFYYYEIDPTESTVYTGNMVTDSIKMNDVRKTFYKKLNENGFESTVNSFVKVSIADKIFEKSKFILYKTNILKILKKIKNKI